MNRDDMPLASLINAGSIPVEAVPVFTSGELSRILGESLGIGLRISAYFGAQVRDGTGTQLLAILADDERNKLYAGRASVAGGGFPSIAKEHPQAQLFEREIAEQFGLVPEGHPWLKPVRSNCFQTSDSTVDGFYRVEGEQVHEVADMVREALELEGDGADDLGAGRPADP